MKFGTSHQMYCNDYLTFNYHKICCEAGACHLGNLIRNNVKGDHVQKNINNFISNVNTILCHFHMTNTEVKHKLFKVILYATLWLLFMGLLRSRCSKQIFCNLVKMYQTIIECTI